MRRDIGSRDASLSSPGEEDISDSPVHVLERVGFPRNRHYTQVCMDITSGRPLGCSLPFRAIAPVIAGIVLLPDLMWVAWPLTAF